MSQPRRKKIGAAHGVLARQKVFRIPSGLEVDDIDHYEVTRRRVFFEDVVLLTRHRFRGVTFLLLTGLLTAMLGSFSILIARDDAIVGAWVFVLLCAPFLVAFIVRLVLGVDVVTVWGRRSRARMHFTFRKGRARRLFDELAGEIRSRQEALRNEITEVPPTDEPPPPPPSLDQAEPDDSTS